jgi:hypothetical protein
MKRTATLKGGLAQVPSKNSSRINLRHSKLGLVSAVAQFSPLRLTLSTVSLCATPYQSDAESMHSLESGVLSKVYPAFLKR